METGGVIVPIPYGEGVNGINMLDAGNDATGSREEGSTTGGTLDVRFVYSESATGWGITGQDSWRGKGDDNWAFENNEAAIATYKDEGLPGIEDAVYNYVTTVLQDYTDSYNSDDFQRDFIGCYTWHN